MEIKDGNLVLQLYKFEDKRQWQGDHHSIPLEVLAKALAPYLTVAFAELVTETAKGRETFSREDLEAAFLKGSRFGNYSQPFENMDNLEENEHWRNGRDRDIAAIIKGKSDG